MAIGAGTDIAIESADAVLINSAIAPSKVTIRNIKQNLFWGIFLQLPGIPIVAGVLNLPLRLKLSPMLWYRYNKSQFRICGNQRPAPAIFKHENIRTCEDTACPVSEKLFMKEETIMETVIKVEGMMCSHCKARVEKVCKAVPGTVDAVVDLAAKTVTVTGTADVAALKQAITDADYTVVE